MRKSFICLLGILVCALGFTAASAQPEQNRQTQNAVSAESASSASEVSSAALPSSDIFTRIAEARRLLSSRQTSGLSRDLVNVAAFDPATSQISVFSLPKDEFLVKDADLSANIQAGGAVRVHVVRANGVNTAMTVADASTGRTLVPLMVQFPIVKAGTVAEMAYYTSAHPALLSPAVTEAGKTYVRKMLDAAAARLAENGVPVSPDIVDIAEHLCIVEHTDHKRFMNENRSALFPEILSLYALNEGNTFRYSVSTAGAGGMIQMIPRTYAGVREQHANVSLQADFVGGMRDHANALEAMLLYMNDTWNNLRQSTEVQEALRSGIATKPELMAAGYNSNPMRLPAYLKKGGAEWRTLIPAETQMYLSIYHSIDDTLQLGSSSLSNNDETLEPSAPAFARSSSVATIMSWLGQSLQPSGLLIGRLIY